jgi:hypothetical protein
MWSAMFALLQGRLGDAQQLRARALEMGRRAGDKVAELFAWIQGFYADWEADSAQPEGPPDAVAVAPVRSALQSDLPLILAEAGRIDEARIELSRLAQDGFAAVPNDLNWLASIAGQAQAATELADIDRSRELYRTLSPYRSRAILVGRAAICLGPAELYLGMLAGTIGELELGARHFDAAEAWCETSGARLWRVWVDVHRAGMLARAGVPRDHVDVAAGVAAEALSIAEPAGLGRAARHARQIVRIAEAMV